MGLYDILNVPIEELPVVLLVVMAAMFFIGVWSIIREL